MMRLSILFTLIVGVVLQFFYAGNLPERVANHFGFGGAPNGWMTNDANLFFSVGIIVFISTVFLVLPSVLRKSPSRLISFPKKSYWLAPERKDATIPVIVNWLQFMGALTNVFLLLVFHLVFLANKVTPPRFNEKYFISALVVYLAITIGWLVALYGKFNKIPGHQA